MYFTIHTSVTGLIWLRRIVYCNLTRGRLRHAWRHYTWRLQKLQEYCRTIGRGRLWGPLLLSTKNRNDTTDQYHWSAQPDVPSAARGASVACLSVCKTPFLLAPAEGWGPGLRPPVGFQCPNLELRTLKLRNFDCNFALFGGKIWLWLFYNLFCVMVLRFYTKNFKSFRPKMKAWQCFFQILIWF